MKATLIEYDESFGLIVTAQTKEEAATLARFGINHKSEPSSTAVSVGKKGDFDLEVFWPIRSDSSSRIQHK